MVHINERISSKNLESLIKQVTLGKRYFKFVEINKARNGFMDKFTLKNIYEGLVNFSQLYWTLTRNINNLITSGEATTITNPVLSLEAFSNLMNMNNGDIRNSLPHDLKDLDYINHFSVQPISGNYCHKSAVSENIYELVPVDMN